MTPIMRGIGVFTTHRHPGMTAQVRPEWRGSREASDNARDND